MAPPARGSSTETAEPAGSQPEPGRNSAKNGTSFVGDLLESQDRSDTAGAGTEVEAMSRAAGGSERPLFSESLVPLQFLPPLPPLRPLPPRFLPPPPLPF